jgi:Aspartyl protease
MDPGVRVLFGHAQPSTGVKVYRNLLRLASCFALLASTCMAASPESMPVTIPIRQQQKLLFVQVTINGRGPFWFAVDTGAHHSVIDPYVVEQLGLATKGSTTVTGTGAGNVPAQNVGAIQMRVGNLAVAVPEPLVIDLSGVPIPKWAHGLVGAELLETYVIELDVEKSTMRAFDPSTYKQPANASAVPLVVENHRFFLSVEIEVGNERVTHRVRIDTGSGDSVADEIVKRGTNVRTTTLGNGLGDNFPGYSGVYKAVHIGSFVFHDVWGPGAPHPAVGMEMLRRFTSTFDVPHRQLYLVPNSHFHESFPAPGSD